MYNRVVWGFKDIVSTMFSDINFAPNYLMTDAEVAKRKALVSVFPKAQTLMCYFHVVQSCEEKLQGNVNRKLIMKLKTFTCA
jgi:hypothetical protein